MPFPYLGESQTLDRSTRVTLPGEFVQLSDGFTHYEIGGPGKGPSVVLVPGFSVPYFVWDPTFERLVNSGYQVLRYDLYGRGYSDRPRVKYDMELFSRQLRELLEALGISAPMSVIGLSMGAPILLRFADRYRRKIAKLILIAPAGFPIQLTWPARLAYLPGVGELLFGLMGQGAILKKIVNNIYDPKLVDQFMDRYRAQMRFSGFKRALLSTIRGGMLGDFTELYQRVGKKAPLAMLIWGRNDQTVPFAHSHYVIDAIPGIHFFPVENAGHIPHYEQQELVNNRIVGFLST